jgi:adenosylcobyric acid synthase
VGNAIFVGGTASNVGKSWMATALCRTLYRRGVRVAPFKAQNMSNNSFPCVGGGEIGRSQVAQAEACGLMPEPAMNPVLLKPTGDSCSQVILHGKVWKTVHAKEYYEHAPFLRQEALTAFEDLARRFDTVVMEGAGSVAEINLWGRDFTNLSMAEAVQARCLLVADIERGGVFASILGTLDLLPPAYRRLVRTFAVNRFRGDRALFADGISILEERSQLPCLGLFPFVREVHVDAEDSLSAVSAGSDEAHPKIAILRFPRISNTTDFRLLPQADWLERPNSERYEFIFLPGTKSTLADLAWLRSCGLDSWLLAQQAEGAHIVGICGGYQMLGESIDDPEGIDGTPGCVAGLGLLPVRTVMEPEKTTRVRSAQTPAGARFQAYEIHMGRTEQVERLAPFAILDDGSPEGARKGRVTGTYLHGALESAELVSELFGFTPRVTDSKSWNYDALADWLETFSSREILEELLTGGQSLQSQDQVLVRSKSI